MQLALVVPRQWFRAVGGEDDTIIGVPTEANENKVDVKEESGEEGQRRAKRPRIASEVIELE